MAPISCFDENLEEDRRVNRIIDSIELWKAICASKLLSGVQLILFLNKCDLLSRKLKRGTSRVHDYFPDIDKESNDMKSVAACESLLSRFVSKACYSLRCRLPT
jgi:guanine nucleotide-binding protein subunit alpha